MLRATVTINGGWALTAQGQVVEGIAQMRQGLASIRSIGAELWSPSQLAGLAEAYGKAGQPEDGLTVVTEALALVDRNEGRYYEAELHRLKGELLLKQPVAGEEQAETCFHQALSVAQSQQAKSWELRAATSLARLWHGQGRTSAARDLLAPLYGWFTEGFEVADLKDAKALLEELS